LLILPKITSKEKREDIIYHSERGESNKTIAKWARVCLRTVERILERFKKTGSTDSKIHNCGRKSKISKSAEQKIIGQIEETPDITLNELIEKFDLPLTESGLSVRLKNLGYTFKKRILSP
jgi:transposase